MAVLAGAQVVDAIASRIRGASVTGADDRVYTSRAWPLKVLPAWRVTAENEQIELLTMHGPGLEQHTLLIALNGIAEAVQDLDDVLNELACAALEAIFDEAPPPDALAAMASNLSSLSAVSIGRDLTAADQAKLGEVTVLLQAVFQTLSNEPRVLL